MKTKNVSLQVGYAALVAKYSLRVMPHNAGAATVKETDGLGTMECLALAVKSEGVSLEIMSALFEKIDGGEVREYVRDNKMDETARRIWYLYEMLTGSRLDIDDVRGEELPYADVLDAGMYYTSEPVEVKRQRVRDNLLGDARYCPMIRRTPKLKAFEDKLQPMGENKLAGICRARKWLK
jgi:hypothetical protein